MSLITPFLPGSSAMPCHPAETYSDPLVNPRVSFQQYLLYAFHRHLPFVLGNLFLHRTVFGQLYTSTIAFLPLVSSVSILVFYLIYRLHLQLKPDLTVGGRLRLHVGLSLTRLMCRFSLEACAC